MLQIIVTARWRTLNFSFRDLRFWHHEFIVHYWNVYPSRLMNRLLLHSNDSYLGKKVNSKVLPLSHNNLIHIKSNYIKTAIHPVLYIKKLRYIMGNGCQRFCKDTFIWWHMYTKLLHPNLNNIMHIYHLSYDECLLSWYTCLCLIWFNWKGFYETVLKVDQSNTSE